MIPDTRNYRYNYPMIFTLAIYSSPSSQASDSAYRFAKSLLHNNHTLYRIFFYHDAVYQSSALNTPPQDESNKTNEWRILAQKYDIDLVVCIAAGLRRGVLDAKEAERYEKPASNLGDGFELSGLGQLIDAVVHSDRVITFGS